MVSSVCFCKLVLTCANLMCNILRTHTQSLLKSLTTKKMQTHTQKQGPEGVEVTYVLVLHVFEQPQLSVGSLCVDDGLEGSGQLLHRYLQACLHIKR